MFQPIIIVGAARSGTNMLRDILTQLPGMGTWPCDEINYIWRYGNAMHPLDELEPHLATPRVCKYIRRQFQQLARSQQLRWVVEKTCANSLRVGFVDCVIPDAKYIFLVRDGRDVTASAIKRWQAPLEPAYLAKKARFVPKRDLPFYALSYLGNRTYRLFSGEKRLATWGPRFDGMQEMLRRHSLEEVCAAQWSRSVRYAAYEFSKLSAERVCQVRYEDFVSSPHSELSRILDFIGFDGSDDAGALVHGVSDGSVGRWRQKFTRQTIQAIEPLMRRELEQFGYEMSTATADPETIPFPVPQFDAPIRHAA